MDKYEFNIKVEQIKKLVAKGDYGTSMKIADTIDWRRVRNANLLAMISQVYEKNEEYQEAKEILLLAFERAPIGKRLLYKLTELALKEGSVREAEDYYREFCDLAGEDPRQYLLRYMILKEKNGSDEQLIHALERYVSTELDEKWMYELAELYSQAGMQEQCIAMCDRIMLMFGLGKYVDKAMDLKVQYAPLSSYQMDLVENRDKYEAKLKAVEREFNNKTVLQEEEYDDTAEDIENLDDEAEEIPEADAEPVDIDRNKPASGIGKVTRLPRRELEEETITVQDTAEEDVEDSAEEVAAEETTTEEPVLSAEEDAQLQQADTERALAEEVAKLSAEPAVEQEAPMAQTRLLRDKPNIKPVTSMAARAMEVTPEEIRRAEEAAEEAAIGFQAKMANHLMIEASTPEAGLQMAVDALKQIHLESASKNQVIKISAGKLSQRGIWNVADKLLGKDLIIEQAGELSVEDLEDLRKLIEADTSGLIVVLIDRQRQLEELHQQNPDLASLFECIGSEKCEEPVVQEEEIDIEAALQKQLAEEEKRAQEAEQMPQAMAVVSDKEKTANIEVIRESEPEDEMDPDRFAEYACKYASEIDCSISGKSMLALYERIEIMEEDGIPLTKKNAEDLIEEAADKAEKPSLGGMIKGVFRSKYDKEGLLILREEHFI